MTIRYCSHNYSVFPNSCCPNCAMPVQQIINNLTSNIESYMSRKNNFSLTKEQKNEIIDNYSYYLSNKKAKLLLLAMYFYIRRHQPELVDLKNDLESDDNYWALLLMIVRG